MAVSKRLAFQQSNEDAKVDFGDFRVDLSPSDVVMSWLRLQQASDWTPHPYWMYTKCFRSLRWCEWPYEFTLTLIGLCRWGADFGFLGVDLSPSDVVMSWLRLQEASDCIRHPYWMYSVLAPWHTVYRHMGVHPYTVRPAQVGGGFRFIGVDLML